MRAALERNLNALLACGFLAGMFLPGLERLPPEIVPALMAVTIFFSCAKITPADIRGISLRDVSLFYLLRLLVVPVAMFYAATLLIPGYAFSVLLLAIMPVSVACGALVMAFGGNMAICLVLITATNLLAPFAVPPLFAALAGTGLEVDATKLFTTIALMVLAPAALYVACVRPVKKARYWTADNANLFAVLMMTCLLAIVISKQRDQIFADPVFLAAALAVTFAQFFLFFALGWLCFARKERRERITYTVCSGWMNNALGIALALLYFPPEVTLFMVLSEIPWVVFVPLLAAFLKRGTREGAGQAAS